MNENRREPDRDARFAAVLFPSRPMNPILRELALRREFKRADAELDALAQRDHESEEET